MKNASVDTAAAATPNDGIKRFPDGEPKPFLPAAKYDQLRDDDRFLYNREPRARRPLTERNAR